jgi:hypothetical protein
MVKEHLIHDVRAMGAIACTCAKWRMVVRLLVWRALSFASSAQKRERIRNLLTLSVGKAAQQMDAIISLVDDDDPAVQVAAMKATFLFMGIRRDVHAECAQSAVSLVYELAREPATTPTGLACALRILGCSPHPTTYVEIILQNLEHHDVDVRRASLFCLPHVGLSRDDLQRLLRHRMADDSLYVRAEAIRTISLVGEAGAVFVNDIAAILHVAEVVVDEDEDADADADVDEGDYTIRIAEADMMTSAVEALGMLRPAAAVHIGTIVARLFNPPKHNEVKFRQKAFKALSALSPHVQSQHLVELMRHCSRQQRRRNDNFPAFEIAHILGPFLVPHLWRIVEYLETGDHIDDGDEQGTLSGAQFLLNILGGFLHFKRREALLAWAKGSLARLPSTSLSIVISFLDSPILEQFEARITDDSLWESMRHQDIDAHHASAALKLVAAVRGCCELGNQASSYVSSSSSHRLYLYGIDIRGDDESVRERTRNVARRIAQLCADRLGDPEPKVREVALTCLMECTFQTQNVVDLVVARLQDPNQLHVLWALLALRCACFHHPDGTINRPRLRRERSPSVDRFPGDVAVRDLVRIIGDHLAYSEGVRRVAVDILETCSEPAVGSHFGLLCDYVMAGSDQELGPDEPGLRMRMLCVLCNAFPSLSLTSPRFLGRLLQDGDANIRRRAMHGIEQLGLVGSYASEIIGLIVDDASETRSGAFAVISSAFRSQEAPLENAQIESFLAQSIQLLGDIVLYDKSDMINNVVGLLRSVPARLTSIDILRLGQLLNNSDEKVVSAALRVISSLSEEQVDPLCQVLISLADRCAWTSAHYMMAYEFPDCFAKLWAHDAAVRYSKGALLHEQAERRKFGVWLLMAMDLQRSKSKRSPAHASKLASVIDDHGTVNVTAKVNYGSGRYYLHARTVGCDAIKALTSLHTTFGPGSTTRFAHHIVAGFETATLARREHVLEYMNRLGEEEVAPFVSVVVPCLACPFVNFEAEEYDGDDDGGGDDDDDNESVSIGLALLFEMEEKRRIRQLERDDRRLCENEIGAALKILKKAGRAALPHVAAVAECLAGLSRWPHWRRSSEKLLAVNILANFGEASAPYLALLNGILNNTSDNYFPNEPGGLHHAAMVAISAIATHCVSTVHAHIDRTTVARFRGPASCEAGANQQRRMIEHGYQRATQLSASVLKGTRDALNAPWTTDHFTEV